MSNEHNFRRVSHVSVIENIRDRLIRFLSDHPLFRHNKLEHRSTIVRNGIGIRLELSPKTYADAYYIWDGEINAFTCGIVSVASDLGQSTGFFLFHLHLLIAVLGGAKEITLDNDTKEPERARKGIYRLFEANLRSMTPSERREMTEANLLQKPELVHIIGRSSLARIHRAIMDRVHQTMADLSKIKEEERVWRDDAEETMVLLFRMIRQTFNTYSGGSRKGSSRKYKTIRRRYLKGKKKTRRSSWGQ